MSGDREQDIVPQNSEAVDKFIQRLREEGGISASIPLSMQLEILAQVSVLADRMTQADRSRQELATRLDKVIDKQNEIRTHENVIENISETLKTLQAEMKLNTEFRQRFMGGSAIAKVLWVGIGGAAVWFLENYIRARN